MTEAKELSANDMHDGAAKQRCYTTLPITTGAYPFALGKGEELTNDQWAWSFLRLNPFYRHDFELQRQLPSILKIPTHRSVAEHVGNPPPQVFQELDSRFFSLRGKILSGKCTWPDYAKQTIAEYRLNDSEFRFSEVKIRDFDSGRDYGIAHWLDPALERLPPLQPGQSWFSCLFEPMWATASQDISFCANENSTLLFDGRKIFVGHNGEVRRIKFQTVWKRKSKSLPDGAELSWLENIVDEADKAFPPDPSFATQTEMVFLIDLDMYVEPQLAQVRRIASSFQKLLQQEGLSKKLPRPPYGFEPLMFHPARAVAQGFSGIRATYEDLVSRSAQSKKNCRVILLDAAYSLPNQISDVAKLLIVEQEKLQAAGELPHPIRKKAGNDAGGDHWLKRALCLLELHVNKQRLGAEGGLGATRLCRIIFDPRDSLHGILRGGQHSLVKANPATVTQNVVIEETFFAKLDAVKEALKVGKALSEFGYPYLIGMPD